LDGGGGGDRGGIYLVKWQLVCRPNVLPGGGGSAFMTSAISEGLSASDGSGTNGRMMIGHGKE
jgi:hypothetical protein